MGRPGGKEGRGREAQQSVGGEFPQCIGTEEEDRQGDELVAVVVAMTMISWIIPHRVTERATSLVRLVGILVLCLWVLTLIAVLPLAQLSDHIASRLQPVVKAYFRRCILGLILSTSLALSFGIVLSLVWGSFEPQTETETETPVHHVESDRCSCSTNDLFSVSFCFLACVRMQMQCIQVIAWHVVRVFRALPMTCLVATVVTRFLCC